MCCSRKSSAYLGFRRCSGRDHADRPRLGRDAGRVFCARDHAVPRRRRVQVDDTERVYSRALCAVARHLVHREPVLGQIITSGVRILVFAVVTGIGTQIFTQILPSDPAIEPKSGSWGLR